MALASSKTNAMVGHWPDTHNFEEGDCNGGSRPLGGRTTAIKSGCLNAWAQQDRDNAQRQMKRGHDYLTRIDVK